MNSETITQRIWQHSKATGSNKLMLLALAQHADVDGFCWPGYEALGALAGITGKAGTVKRNAMRNLAPVIEAGEVMVWEQQGQHGGRGYTNIYLITVGLTGDQIREIVQRRFELKGDEIDTVLSKKGDKYVTLCYLKRVTIETLLRTREAQKGDKNDTRTIEESNPIESIIDNPITSPIGEGGKPPTSPVKIPEPIPKVEYTEFEYSFLTYFSAKRFKNPTQHKTIAGLIAQHGETEIDNLAQWAAKRGMGLGQAIPAIESALKKHKNGVHQNGKHQSESAQGGHYPSTPTNQSQQANRLDKTAAGLGAALASKSRGSRDPT